jgi:tRNA G37 N-methylase TrmD
VQLDVFTLVPHAFAWLTEQRPLASVLGDELELSLFNYRDFSPLRAGQVDDEPFGGGAFPAIASSRSPRRAGRSTSRSSRSWPARNG